MEIYNDEQVKVEQERTKKAPITLNSGSLVIAKIYLWFALGLLLTGGMAIGMPLLLVAIAGSVENAFGAYITVLIISMIVFIPTAFAIHLSSFSKHAGLIGTFYVLFALSFGSLLSCVTLYVQTSTLLYAFLITAGSFAIMGVLGFVTKGKIGAPMMFLIALAFGLTFVSLINVIFFQGSQYYIYYWIISIVILVFFLLEAAVDTNRVLRNANNLTFANSNTMVIYSAYVLYSDFMIIFYYVLRLFLMFSNKNN